LQASRVEAARIVGQQARMLNVTMSSALSGLYATEQGRLRRIARRITGCRETAEDVVQDAFIKLAGRRVEARDIGLVVRTTQNLARDAVRAARVRTVYASKVTDEQVVAGIAAPDEAVFASLRSSLSAFAGA